MNETKGIISLCFMLLILISCGPGGKPASPGEELRAYCIRECVIETADSEICDTWCTCAARNLESGMKAAEFASFVGELTKDDSDGVNKLRAEIRACADKSE